MKKDRQKVGHFYKMTSFDFKDFMKSIIESEKERMQKKSIILTIENPKGKGIGKDEKI